MSLFWFFTIIQVIVVIIFMVGLKYRRKRTNWLEAGFIFLVVYTAYSVIGNYDRIKGNYVSINVAIEYGILIFIGSLAFSLGYLLIGFPNDEFKMKEKKDVFKKSISVSDLFLIMLVILSCIIFGKQYLHMIMSFGSGLSYVENAARGARTALSGPISLLSTFSYIIILGYCFYIMFEKKRFSIIALLPIIIFGVYYLASGGRSILLFIGIGILLVYNENYKRIKLYQLVGIAIIGVTGLVLLGHIRNQSTIAGMIHSLLTLDNVSELASVTSSGEFFNTTGTFVSYIQSFQTGNLSMNFGYTYLVELLVWIPYFLFSGRPLPPAEQFMKDFYPEAPSGTGHGWFVLNDGFMSFGVIGVFVGMFVFGLFLSWLYRFYLKEKTNSIIQILYIQLLLYMVIVVRGSVMGSIKNYLLETIPLLFAYAISRTNMDVKIRKKE